MKFPLRGLIREQKGASIALIGFALAALLGMTGVVVDIGVVYVNKTQLDKAANAAALSGAQELTRSEEAVAEVVGNVLHEHAENDSLAEQHIVLGDKVTVGLEREVPLMFSGIFGIKRAPVAVLATAEIVPMGRASGVAPLGIDDSIPLEFGVTYTLKVDQTESDTGYFGVLALGGPGANTYEDNLKYGYRDEIGIGDILQTQTGNIAGKTRDGVRYRIDNCPYPPGETFHRDCSRILLVPVYRPHNRHSNQLKEVEVTGFAYFYLQEPMNWHDKTIKGMFVERAGSGYAEPGAADNGAYAIRLTE